MYTKMLVPLDASELAAASFTYAKELAARLALDVILLHVCGAEERGPASPLEADIKHKAEIMKRQSEEVRGKIGIKPGGKAIQVRGEVAIGSPAEEIIRCAAENNVDLILMATHGRSGVKRLVMGSVADKVLRASNVPVWLVRPGLPEQAVYEQWPGKTILVPLDGSELAATALAHVEALASQQGIEKVDVILLRICTRPMPPPAADYTYTTLPEEYTQMELARRKQVAKKYLAEIEGQLTNKGFAVRSEVLEGRPAEQIVEYANANPYNLIVMSTHARSGLQRLARGSVATYALQKANSPIVIVKTRRAE